MNSNQIRKEIDSLRQQIPIKQMDLSVFERIDLYTEIMDSDEYQAYKYAMIEDREQDASDIYDSVPDDWKELFMHIYERNINYFDKLEQYVHDTASVQH